MNRSPVGAVDAPRRWQTEEVAVQKLANTASAIALGKTGFPSSLQRTDSMGVHGVDAFGDQGAVPLRAMCVATERAPTMRSASPALAASLTALGAASPGDPDSVGAGLVGPVARHNRRAFLPGVAAGVFTTWGSVPDGVSVAPGAAWASATDRT